MGSCLGVESAVEAGAWGLLTAGIVRLQRRELSTGHCGGCVWGVKNVYAGSFTEVGVSEKCL